MREAGKARSMATNATHATGGRSATRHEWGPANARLISDDRPSGTLFKHARPSVQVYALCMTPRRHGDIPESRALAVCCSHGIARTHTGSSRAFACLYTL